LDISKTTLEGVLILTPRRFADERGYFSESWNRETLQNGGLNLPEFVQDNHSLSRKAGTLRGLHFQAPPFAQGKLVRCGRGSVFDVAVDIRRGSPTFGKHVSAVLSADNWQQLWVPKGFAHGFVTLEDDTEVIYKVSGKYAPECDRGLIWNDRDLAINWPVDEGEIELSHKDEQMPGIAQAADLFVFDQYTKV